MFRYFKVLVFTNDFKNRHEYLDSTGILDDRIYIRRVKGTGIPNIFVYSVKNENIEAKFQIWEILPTTAESMRIFSYKGASGIIILFDSLDISFFRNYLNKKINEELQRYFHFNIVNIFLFIPYYREEFRKYGELINKIEDKFKLKTKIFDNTDDFYLWIASILNNISYSIEKESVIFHLAFVETKNPSIDFGGILESVSKI
ncbi:MAG: hypothetical protein ACTSPQ_13120 [Candidatus Helarchaeota archaeon]